MTQLHQSVRRGDKQAVLDLLRAGKPINSGDDQGFTPLMLAASSQSADVDMLRILLENGSDVNGVNLQYGATPFGCALQNADKTRFLLARGADPFRGRLASKCMPHTSSKEVLLLLLDLDFDPTCSPPLVFTAGECPSVLDSAARDCDWETIKILKERQISLDGLEWTELMRAIVFGSVEDVEGALKDDGDLSARDAWSRTPLLLSVCSSNTDKAEMLFAVSSAHHQRGRHHESLFDCAILSRSLPMMEWVHSHDFDVNMPGLWEDPLLFACMKDNVAAVQFLLQNGAHVELDNPSRLYLNEVSEPEIVRLLIEHGATLNQVDDTGMFPLKHAVETESIDLLKVMLELGADPKLDSLGFTALHQAVIYDHIEMIKLLLTSGADPNTVYDGRRALWYCESRETAQVLIEYGASLTACDEFGNNAFRFHGTADFRDLLGPRS